MKRIVTYTGRQRDITGCGCLKQRFGTVPDDPIDEMPHGVPVAGGIEAECPTHHATEHHLPATTRMRQAGDGDNRETTSLRQTHLRLTLKPPLVKHLPLKPQLFQRTPQLRIRLRLGVGAARILPPSVTPNLPPHHLRQPTLPAERPATQSESPSQAVYGASPSRHPLPRSALYLHFTATHVEHVASSESGCASTHACRATCQRRNAGDQDDPSSGPPTHPDRT